MCFYLKIHTRSITATCQELEAIFMERWWFTFFWVFSDFTF